MKLNSFAVSFCNIATHHRSWCAKINSLFSLLNFSFFLHTYEFFLLGKPDKPDSFMGDGFTGLKLYWVQHCCNRNCKIIWHCSASVPSFPCHFEPLNHWELTWLRERWWNRRIYVDNSCNARTKRPAARSRLIKEQKRVRNLTKEEARWNQSNEIFFQRENSSIFISRESSSLFLSCLIPSEHSHIPSNRFDHHPSDEKSQINFQELKKNDRGILERIPSNWRKGIQKMAI